jgi:hypothetical protein
VDNSSDERTYLFRAISCNVKSDGFQNDGGTFNNALPCGDDGQRVGIRVKQLPLLQYAVHVQIEVAFLSKIHKPVGLLPRVVRKLMRIQDQIFSGQVDIMGSLKEISFHDRTNADRRTIRTNHVDAFYGVENAFDSSLSVFAFAAPRAGATFAFGGMFAAIAPASAHESMTNSRIFDGKLEAHAWTSPSPFRHGSHLRLPININLCLDLEAGDGLSTRITPFFRISSGDLENTKNRTAGCGAHDGFPREGAVDEGRTGGHEAHLHSGGNMDYDRQEKGGDLR